LTDQTVAFCEDDIEGSEVIYGDTSTPPHKITASFFASVFDR
jgi:hypothetical protein